MKLIEKALAHIAAIHPSVVQVTYDDDLRWAYTAADGSGPRFNGQEDVGLLEDAADEAYVRGLTNTPVFIDPA